MEILDLFSRVFQRKERELEKQGVVCRFPLDLKPSEVSYFPSPLHKGPFQWAVDIGCQDGQVVYSPIGGKIIYLRQDSREWKNSKDFVGNPNKYLNWITVQVWKNGKPTNRVVQLCHIEADSCLKENGSFVREGEKLARVGINGVITTGKSGEPDIHLHIAAFEGKSTSHPLADFKGVKVFFNSPQIPDPYSPDAFRWLSEK